MALFKLSHRHFINWRILARIMGWLLLIEGIFMLVPTLTCVAYGESDWLPFAATAALTLATGTAFARFSHPISIHIGKRD